MADSDTVQTLSTPGISILMATYNGERFIGEQLKSLAAQSIAPAELVIVDDQSSDSTLDIARKFAETAPFPVLIEKNKERKGYKRNFLDGIRLCSHEIVAFCDQDDFWHAEKIGLVGMPFRDPNVLLVHHNANILVNGSVDRSFHPKGKYAEVQDRLTYYPEDYAYGFAISFRRCLDDFHYLINKSIDPHFPAQPLAHDQWTFFLASSLGSIAYIDVPLVDYRQHQNNLFGAGPEDAQVGILNKLASKEAPHFIRRKLHKILHVDLTAMQIESDVATNKAVLLEDIAANMRFTQERRSAASEAASKHKRRANNLNKRLQIYKQPKFRNKLRTLVPLLISSGDAGGWSHKRKTLLKDIVCAMQTHEAAN